MSKKKKRDKLAEALAKLEETNARLARIKQSTDEGIELLRVAQGVIHENEILHHMKDDHTPAAAAKLEADFQQAQKLIAEATVKLTGY